MSGLWMVGVQSGDTLGGHSKEACCVAGPVVVTWLSFVRFISTTDVVVLAVTTISGFLKVDFRLYAHSIDTNDN
jgi:hypothetical protein